MSLLDTKKSLEKYLAALSPSIQTSYEGVTFNPTPGTPYQYVQITPWQPENPTLGDQYFRDIGEFQVFLCYPTGRGTGEVLARAELVRLHFKRGTTLTEGASKVLIIDTPKIAGAMSSQDRIVIPVLIRYSVEEF
jgi:hypothetical protein